MRAHPKPYVERGRIIDDQIWGSDPNSGITGAYAVRSPYNNLDTIRMIASDGVGGEEVERMWEHVSVSFHDRNPTWNEMQWVKEQFWEDEEVCYQLHPAKSEYVSHHPYCLHIWRHKIIPCPMPPSILVGPKK